MSSSSLLNEKISRSAAIRAKLNHPIIDSDGHVAEFEPEFFDYLKEVGGETAVSRLKALPDSPFSFRWYRLSEEETTGTAGATAPLVGPSDTEYAGPGDQFAAEAVVSAAGRDGNRFYDRLSELGAVSSPFGRW